MQLTKETIEEITNREVKDKSAQKIIISTAARLNGELISENGTLITNIHARSYTFAKMLNEYIQNCYDEKTSIIRVKANKSAGCLEHIIIQHKADTNILIRKAGLIDKTGLPVIGLSTEVVHASKQLKKYAAAAAFISIGTINDPRKNGNVEFLAPSQSTAMAINGILDNLGIIAKSKTPRGFNKIIINDKNEINDFLVLIGAPVCAQRFTEEYIYIPKVMNTALSSTLVGTNTIRSQQASLVAIVRAKRALEILKDAKVKDELKQAAKVRIDNPGISLEKLGLLSSPIISKDAIASRLRRLNQLADKHAKKLGIPNTVDIIKK